MTETAAVPGQITRPINKGISEPGGNVLKPWEYDADLAQHKLAELMIQKLGTPSYLDKEFAVRYGIFRALNHREPREFEIDGRKVITDDGNLTGYDSSLRVSIYEKYARESVNENGMYFRNFWAYMMKPKYIIQGAIGMDGMEPEEKRSITGRIADWWRGGGKRNDSTNNGN